MTVYCSRASSGRDGQELLEALYESGETSCAAREAVVEGVEDGPTRDAAVPGVIHQLDLQPEMRPLLLLAESEPAQRSLVRRDQGAGAGVGALRKPQPVGRGTVPAQRVRRDLPVLRHEQWRERDLRADERVVHGQDANGAGIHFSREEPPVLRV